VLVQLPSVDRLEEVVGGMVEASLEKEGAADDCEGEGGCSLAYGVVEPVEHRHCYLI